MAAAVVAGIVSLGLLSYYGKFLPRAQCLALLYKLLGHNTKWEWKSAQDKAFENSKRMLTSSNIFNLPLPLITCDASTYGIGVVLAH